MKFPGLKSLGLSLLKHAFCTIVERKAQKGHLEVERKFQITKEEMDRLTIRLRELNFEPAGTAIMTDYFLPVAEKGEMMRIRDESLSGTAHILFTHKSWYKTADGGKERQEAEAEASSFAKTVFLILGYLLSGKSLLSFTKERMLFEGKIGTRAAVISLDTVEGLGEFSGYYLEAETIVPLHEDSTIAREQIFNFAEQAFGKPRDHLKTSYFEMLELSTKSTKSRKSAKSA